MKSILYLPLTSIPRRKLTIRFLPYEFTRDHNWTEGLHIFFLEINLTMCVYCLVERFSIVWMGEVKKGNFGRNFFFSFGSQENFVTAIYFTRDFLYTI